MKTVKRSLSLFLLCLFLPLCASVNAQTGPGSVQVPVSLSAYVQPLETQDNWWISGDISSHASSTTPSLDHIYSYLYLLDVEVTWTFDAVFNGVVTASNLHDSQGWTRIREEEGPHIWPKDSVAEEQYTHLCSFNAGTLFNAGHPSEGGVSYTLRGLRFRYRETVHLIYFEAGIRHSAGSGQWTEPTSEMHTAGNP